MAKGFAKIKSTAEDNGVKITETVVTDAENNDTIKITANNMVSDDGTVNAKSGNEELAKQEERAEAGEGIGFVERFEDEESLLKTIFASVFTNDADVIKRNKVKILTMITDSHLLRDEYYVFYTMLKSATNVVMFNERYITTFLKIRKGEFIKARDYISLNNYAFGGLDTYTAFGASCLKKFAECWEKQVEDIEVDTALEMLKMQYVEISALDTLEEAAVILRDGKKVGHKELRGYESMRSHLSLKLSKLDTLNQMDGSKGFIVYDGNEDETEEEPLKEIGKYGIAALDDKGIAVMEGDMISLLAPTKGGKSKFSVFLMHSMVTQGVSVVSWSIENGYKGWESMMRARHFNYKWNKEATNAQSITWIDSEQIRKGQLTGSTKELEAASWMDLKSNKNYGRMLAIDRPFELSTYLDILEEAVDSIQAKFVCIDYLQLVDGDKGMTKAEAISKVYIKTLQFLKRKKIAGIFPAQLKQDVVNELNKTKPENLMNVDLRTGAGESYEVYKTPDVNFCMFGNTSDIRDGNLKLLLLPSRNFAPIPPINLAAQFGTCSFVSVD